MFKPLKHFLSVLFFILAMFDFAVRTAEALTLLYSGEEHGHLGLHGCGAEQVGGLAHRLTLLDDLRIRHGTVLNLHTGNLIDPTDANAEWGYQIGLAAVNALQIDVFCLGPNEVSLSQETLAGVRGNHPEVPVVCANVASDIWEPYRILPVSATNVSIVGLIAESQVSELPAGVLIPPRTVLAAMKTELLRKSDVVVVVFHATQEEARQLGSAFPWIDILIVAGDDRADPAAPRAAAVFRGETAIVSTASQGTAVGVLEVETDGVLQGYKIANAYHLVSEKIAPNAELARLLDAYETLTATPDAFETVSAHQVSARSIHVVYFHKQGCQKCARAMKMLKTLKAKYPNIVVDQRDAKTEQARLEAMGALYDVPETQRLTTPAVFIGDTAWIGELDEKRLETGVEKHLSTGVGSRLPEAETQLNAAETHIVARFQSFGALAVAGAGFLDGVNPCAFATLVFFISYMNLVGRRRKEMLIAGGAFALSVFLTYLLLGLGTLSFMKYLQQFSGVATCVYLLAATATFALAGLSLYDGVKAKQGKTTEILLQLPRAVKLRIHDVIRERTRTSGVIAGALVIGFVISALELVCTGQVYLPTLTFVSGMEGMRRDAIVYLLLYNVMFIVPLLIVFSCVYWGATSQQLGGLLQRHLVTVKVGIGFLLFGLGTWLVFIVVA